MNQFSSINLKRTAWGREIAFFRWQLLLINLKAVAQGTQHFSYNSHARMKAQRELRIRNLSYGYSLVSTFLP